MVFGFALSRDDAVNDTDVGRWPLQRDLVFDSGLAEVGPSLLVRGSAPLWYLVGIGLLFASLAAAWALRGAIVAGSDSVARAQATMYPVQHRGDDDEPPGPGAQSG